MKGAHHINQLRLGLCIGSLTFWLFPACVQAEPLAVIVNKKNAMDGVSVSRLSSVYRGEILHWSNGGRIKLVNREISSRTREIFYRTILNAKPSQTFYRAGTPVAVQSLIQRSDEAVVRFVAAIEGAIGYVAASKLDDSVKVILLIEKEAE